MPSARLRIGYGSPSGGLDLAPDQFTFTDLTNVALSTLITSAAVTIAGLGAGINITLSAIGGTIDRNGDGNFQTTQIVRNGDTVRAQMTSSALGSTAVNCTVTAQPSGVSDVFTTTTIVGGVSNALAEADWTARSTAAGVVFATDFRNATDVSNWIFPNSGASRVVRDTTDYLTGSGCLRINTPASLGDDNNSAWLHPLSSAWTTNQQGFGSTRWYMQLRVKLPASRLTCGSNGGGFKLFNIGECMPTNFGSSRSHPNGEIVLTSYATYDLIPWLYRDIDFSQDPLSVAFGGGGDLKMHPALDNGSTIANVDVRYGLWRSGTSSISPGCFRWPTDEWFTLHVEGCTPSRGSGASGVGNNLKLAISREGSTTKIPLWDAQDFIIGEDGALPLGPNGLWLLNFDTGRTSSSVDTHTKYGQVIVSTQPIATPALLPVPSWWSSLADSVWTAIAGSGKRISDVLPSPLPATTLSGESSLSITRSWDGMAVDTVRRELFMGANGGHADYPGNEAYSLNLLAATPAWQRLSESTPQSYLSVISAGSNHAVDINGVQCYEDNRIRADHTSGWQSFADGRVWYAAQSASTSGGGNAGEGSYSYRRAGLAQPGYTLPMAHTDNGGAFNPWEVGQRTLPAGASSNGSYTFGCSCYDPIEGYYYWFSGLGYDRTTFYYGRIKTRGPNIGATERWTANSGNPFANAAWVVCCPDLRIIVIGDGSTNQRLLVLNLDDVGTGTSFQSVSNVSGSGAYFGQTFKGCGAGYVRANHSIGVGDPKYNGNQIRKVTIPLNGSNQYDPTGAWVWSTISAGGATLTYDAGDAGIYNKFNFVPDMGDGRAAFVFCGGTTVDSYVYKVPAAGL